MRFTAMAYNIMRIFECYSYRQLIDRPSIIDAPQEK